MSVNEQELLQVIADLEAQGIASVCTACTEKVAVLRCPHGGAVMYGLDGTPHPCIVGRDAEGRPKVAPAATFYGAYAGYSGADLLEEARRIAKEAGRPASDMHARPGRLS